MLAPRAEQRHTHSCVVILICSKDFLRALVGVIVQREEKVVLRVGEIRVDGKRRSVAGDGGIVLAEVLQRGAHVRMGCGVARLDRQ